MQKFILLFLIASPLFCQTEKILYKVTPQDSLFLHVYMPEKVREDGAAIVFFFGGGWVQGDATHFASHARHLADLGMVAFCADYRTFNKHQTTPFECVADGQDAMRWIRKHAADLHIHPQKIIAVGGSAGGHIAACTTLIEPFDLSVPTSCRANLLILFNPVVDTSEQGFGHARCGEDWQRISPVHHIKSGMPATLIFHGTADTTVPFENVLRFQKLMLENGNDCELIAFPGETHGFFNVGRNNNLNYEKTLKLMDAFLQQLHFLD